MVQAIPSSGAAQLDAVPTRRRSVARSWVLAGLRLMMLPLWTMGVAVWAWPLYLVVRASGVRRPPVMPAPARFWEVLRGLTRPLPAPGLAAVDRFTVAVALGERALAAPLSGFAWWMDSVLFGARLAAVTVRAPLFELSAARSGSTQLAHYLEDDPGLVAPSTLRLLAPYLWVWWIAERTVGRCISAETVQRLFESQMSKSHLERHEANAFRTDSIDPIFYSFHLGDLLNTLGPDALGALDPSVISTQNRVFWEEDFVAYTEGAVRKTLLAYGGGVRRAFVKGHFLAAGDALAARFPGAVFLTVIREPVKRIQSVVNFHREQPGEVVAAIPWSWLVARALPSELRYNDQEQRWFTQADGPKRVVIRFDDYVRDLPGTLARVYRECLDDEVPPTLPTDHARRKRSYTTDRSLEELGVDMPALLQRAEAFARWARGR